LKGKCNERQDRYAQFNNNLWPQYMDWTAPRTFILPHVARPFLLEITMNNKKCTKCGKEFPATVEYFYRHTQIKDGLSPECKECSKKCCKKWTQANPDKVREYCKKWNKKNRDKTRETKKKWAQANPGKQLQANKKWRKKNKGYDKKYRDEKPSRRINDNISGGIFKALKGAKHGQHWEDLVGYTLDDLMRHLESLFTEGMTWANYGKWHLDHIIPRSAFNFASPEDIDFQRCWALKNLQPMWASENISKSNNIDGVFQPSLAI